MQGLELLELIPFGILSDRYGRRLFIFLQTFSAATSSIWLIVVGLFAPSRVEIVLSLIVLQRLSMKYFLSR